MGRWFWLFLRKLMVPSYYKRQNLDLFLDGEVGLLLDLVIELLSHEAAGGGVILDFAHDLYHLVVVQQIAFDHVPELAEPFVVKSHGPVFAKELRDIGHQSAFESDAQLVEVLLG